MKNLKINGVMKGQWKQLCPLSWKKCEGSETLLTYKIRRAVDLGKETYTYYSNGCKIIRYHYHNLLVSNNEVMTMWKDESRQPYNVSEKRKRQHKEDFFGTNGRLIRPIQREELTEGGFNKNIKINSKQTAESLMEYGFTNHHEPTLYYGRNLGNEISFNLSVDKKTLEIKKIDVLDENFCQPYDYQRTLLLNRGHEFARRIYHQVNNVLSKLQDDGVITGFEVGMYV